MLIKTIAIASTIGLGISVSINLQEETFVDSIYGQLVDTESSRRYKYEQFEKGELERFQAIPERTSEVSIQELFEYDGSYRQLLDFYILNQKTNQHQEHTDEYYLRSHKAYQKYSTRLQLPNDDDVSDLNGTRDLFGGIVTFGNFRHFNCFNPELYTKPVDIAIIGAPFDTGVSYRPGARFGPNAIREAGKRLGGMSVERGRGNKNSKLNGINPYNPKTHNLSIIDCGDIPMTPFDNRIALNQLYRGQRSVHKHSTKTNSKPRIITMGGDHTITLMTLKSAYEQYGPISVLHFDSHIDTWNPKVLGGGISHYMSLNHGTFLHYAAENGYLKKDSCFHLGMRAPYIDSTYDQKHDEACGFHAFTARDLDVLGKEQIIRRVKDAVGDGPVYISVDIDVLDPANAPGTGTMEIGGWTGRELLEVLDGLEGIHLVGGDVVEVSPPYDSNSEITSLAATAVIDSLLGLMIVDVL